MSRIKYLCKYILHQQVQFYKIYAILETENLKKKFNNLRI